jgi:hypothetical protein
MVTGRARRRRHPLTLARDPGTDEISTALEIARKAGHLPLGTFHKNLAKLDAALAL